ncbi:hypothetical protein GCM10009869_05760 [Amnibacterium kyonggiense]
MLVAAGWRAALVLIAAAVVALEAPAWARLPLSAAAAVGVGTFFLRRVGRRGLLEGVLVLAGGGLVALVVLGLLLNLLPTGLDPVSWAVAVGVLELVVLALLAVVRAPAERSTVRRRLPIAGIAWGTAAGLVLVGAIVYSTASFDGTHVRPLAVAAQPSGEGVTLSIMSGAAVGPLDVELVTADGRTAIARGVRLHAGETWTERISDPGSRAVVQVVREGSTAPLRQLILDEGSDR